MSRNFSPWIDQLNRTREVHTLSESRQTDVAIVGAGIAGITTTYFALKYTNFYIFLVESDKVAHGATGHNAGQLTSYFERQITNLVKEFGISQTAQAQSAVDSAWELLEEIYKDANLETPFAQFTGYAGCQDLNELLVHLENNLYTSVTHINSEPVLVAEEWEDRHKIPEKFKNMYSIVPQVEILSLLETENKNYIALLSARKGVMNSAMFCEELLSFIFKNYADRFTLVEESPVHEIMLFDDHAKLLIRDSEIVANKVILCTNGFEKFKINNVNGEDIDTAFHQTVLGCVGYMAGYLEEHTRSPIAISYLPPNSEQNTFPYFYLTRRTFEKEKNQLHSLVCIGGPEIRMDNTSTYDKHGDYPANAVEAEKEIDEFLHSTYKFAPENVDYKYKWHGLMGYTPNGVRRVGPEPINPVLLYNLGCNGIGILPSIFAGRKIARFLNSEDLPKSIFDPTDSRIK